MHWYIHLLLWFVVVVISIPSLTFIIQCALACLFKSRERKASAVERNSCAILMPSHNEELGIGSTLSSLQRSIRDDDRIVVVADNCTDRTAEIALKYKVEVLQRFDSMQRGKGHAMQFGVDFLRDCPPKTVVFIDADCRVDAYSLDLLVEQAERTQYVTQANYRMRRSSDAGSKASTKIVISQFAVMVKNWVRPSGMSAMGLPTHLTGSGMAFPWEIASRLRFATSNIVEDMALGCDLMCQGWGPRFCEGAVVLSDLPSSNAAALEQRKRWEHGHLDTLIHQLPRVLLAGFRRRQIGLLGIACDLTIPPLSMLVTILAASLVFAGLFFFADPWPFFLLTTELVLMAVALMAVAIRFSDDSELSRAVWNVPGYVLSKLPLYFSFLLFKKQRHWVRTARQPLDTGNT